MHDISDYKSLLIDSVFQTCSKWPHFKLLIDDLSRLGQRKGHCSKVVSLERSIMFDGWSITAPLFSGVEFESYDCSPPSADERGTYNSKLVENPFFIKKIKSKRLVQLDEIPVISDSVDLVLVPNLLHHFSEPDFLISEISRILRIGGEVYIFDSILRELHQEPDDFMRFTPYGLISLLEKFCLKKQKVKTTGGPFEAISYCWIQALEYLPEEIRKEKSEWFFTEHFPQLLDMDKSYKHNLVRKHTSFPVGYSVIAKKAKET